MLIQAGLLSERFRAVGAREGAHARVHPHVLLQTALLREPLRADGALVRFAFRVDATAVFLARLVAWEGLAASATGERGPAVGWLRRVPVEPPLAHLTAERRLTTLRVLLTIVERVFAAVKKYLPTLQVRPQG